MSAKKPASLSESLIARKVAVVPAAPRSAVAEKESVKPASLSESPIARKVAVVPAAPRPAVAEKESVKPASLSESMIARKVAVVPAGPRSAEAEKAPIRAGDGSQSQPWERKPSSLPDWRISAAVAVLFAAGVVTAAWQQTAGERRAASGAVHATDMTTVAEIAAPPPDSPHRAEDGKDSTVEQATSTIATGRSETVLPAPAKAPPQQALDGPPGETLAAAPSASPPALNVSSAAMQTVAPSGPESAGADAAIRPAVKGKPQIRSKTEPAADIVPPPAPPREISTASRPAPGKSATPRPRSRPLAKPAYVIQLSAVKTVAGARRETRRLRRSLGRLLKGRQLQVQKALTRGRGTVYRVHLAGFSNRVGARRLCARIKARALNCLVKKR